MPNNIQNRLTIVGPNVAQIMVAIASDELTAIDFEKIVPMPRDLHISSDGFVGAIDPKNKNHSQRIVDLLDKLRSVNNPLMLENFIQGVRNYISHGHACWYTWAIEYWGTKWNAYGQPDERNNENQIYFQTAWSRPTPILRALVERFPDHSFTLEYADEDFGYNAGIINNSGSEIIEHFFEGGSMEAKNLYMELHKNAAQYYRLIDGQYQSTFDQD